MSTTYAVVAGVTAAFNAAAAAFDFARAGWVMTNMERYGVPRNWIGYLAFAKAAGAVGLLLGLAVPAVGVLAAVGLSIYFVAATVTVARARWWLHLPSPLLFLGLAVASLATA